MVFLTDPIVSLITEPQPLPDLLREDARQTVLHGGPVRRGHEDMDGCDSDRSRGLHTVHELRQNPPLLADPRVKTETVRQGDFK